MATNTSKDVGRSRLGHIAIRTRRVNFKTRHMPLTSSMFTGKPSKSHFISPTACPKQSSARTISIIPLMYGVYLPDELIFCLTRVAISEKSKAATMCRIFMAALTGQTICDFIPADIHGTH
ncbi:hypothetical protein TNCV_323661 [Trichonephila clavipes]|nr:hypothetical protein TNCV_323661 [Trichonephila clavipes]